MVRVVEKWREYRQYSALIEGYQLEQKGKFTGSESRSAVWTGDSHKDEAGLKVAELKMFQFSEVVTKMDNLKWVYYRK